MSDRKDFSVNSLEELAEAFAEIVSRNYLKTLEFWRVTVMDNPNEFAQWKQRIKSYSQEIKKNAYKKILRIMQEPQQNQQFYKKIWWFVRSKEVISITKDSGFYRNLLPAQGIEHTISANVEYLIDKKALTIIKKIYSQY